MGKGIDQGRTVLPPVYPDPGMSPSAAPEESPRALRSVYLIREEDGGSSSTALIAIIEGTQADAERIADAVRVDRPWAGPVYVALAPVYATAEDWLGDRADLEAVWAAQRAAAAGGPVGTPTPSAS